MQLPSTPKNWHDVPRWAAAVNNLLRAIYPRPSPDILPTVGAGGTTFQSLVNPKKSSQILPDFSIYDASVSDGHGGTTKKIGVKNGLISAAGLLLFSDGVTGLPSGISDGGDPPYEQEVANDDTVAYLEIDFDTSGDNPKISTISLNAASSLPASEGTTLYIPLGSFDASGSTLKIGSGQVGIGSQVVQACRNFFVPKDDPFAWNYSYGPA